MSCEFSPLVTKNSSAEGVLNLVLVVIGSIDHRFFQDELPENYSLEKLLLFCNDPLIFNRFKEYWQRETDLSLWPQRDILTSVYETASHAFSTLAVQAEASLSSQEAKNLFFPSITKEKINEMMVWGRAIGTFIKNRAFQEKLKKFFEAN